MGQDLKQVLSAAIIRLLRPLIKIALRNGLSYQAYSELVKWTYVDVAGEEFAIPGRKVSKSRIAVITGLTRREVDRLVRMPHPRDQPIDARRNRAARVLSGWAEDADFHTKDGNPADLPVDREDGEASFAEVVRRYSGNQPTRAVLDELVRVGSVERVDKELVRLIKPYYEPTIGEREPQVIAIMGAAVRDLLGTLDHNMQSNPGKLLFQGEVYEKIPPQAVEEIRQHLSKQCDVFANKMDGYLTSKASQTDDSPEQDDVRMGIGLYTFIGPWSQE